MKALMFSTRLLRSWSLARMSWVIELDGVVFMTVERQPRPRVGSGITRSDFRGGRRP